MATDLDLTVSYDRFIAADDTLDRIQTVLAAAAPQWVRELRVFESSRDQRPVPLDEPSALRTAVSASATRRGPLYHYLVDRHGAGPVPDRVGGVAELRGAGPAITLVAGIDSEPFWTIGGEMKLQNRVTLQIRRAKVEGQAAAAWAAAVLAELCERTAPQWGCLRTQDEWAAKVMADGPGVRAIGMDFARFLPALFPLTFFGSRYCALIGVERLLSAPAPDVRRVDGGVLIGLSGAPAGWDEPERRAEEARVREHLGPELFFDKRAPDRRTVAPDWTT